MVVFQTALFFLSVASLATPFVSCEDESNWRVVNGFDLNDYHSFDQIVKYLNSIQNNRTSVEIIGTSSNKRDIPIVKVSGLFVLRAQQKIKFRSTKDPPNLY